MNLTLYSLFTTYLSSSPMMTFSSTYDKTSTLKFDKLYTRNFFNSFLYTSSNVIVASISQSHFINYIQTPLVFKSEVITLSNSTDQTFSTQLVHKESSTAATIVIEKCTFQNCQASKNGGSIYFQNSGSLTVHGTIFTGSSAGNGGAIFVASTEGAIGADMKSGDAKIFHSHYCCYSSCLAINGYGSAALIAASDIQLNFSSTLKCPGSENAAGAQFDLKAATNSPFIASSNINSTTGKSTFCASLEYRDVNTGYFKFQTIVDHNGGFITSFTKLNNNVDISNCNIINVTVHGSLEKNAPPGVVHVRETGITISDFYFYGIKFASDVTDPRLITHQNGQSNLKTTLRNSCVEAEENANLLNGITVSDVTKVDPGSEEKVTQVISQLFLGDCQGEVKKSPPPIDYVEPDPTSEITSIITSEITPEPTLVPSETEIVPADEPKQRSGGTNKTPIIAGSVAAAVAVVAAAAILAFFLIKKRKSLNFDNDAALNETNDSSITTDNELRKMMSKDDPFENEFENL